MIIFVSKGLHRYLKIGDTYIWRQVQIRDTKFCTNVSHKMLPNAANCQGFQLLSCLKLLMEDQQGGKIAPTQIRVKSINASLPYLKLKTNIISVVLLQKWSIRKKNNSKITTNPFIFLLSFQLVSSRHSYNCHT